MRIRGRWPGSAGAGNAGDGRRHGRQSTVSPGHLQLDRALHRRPYRFRPRLLKRGAFRSCIGCRQQRFRWHDRRGAGGLQLSAAVRAAARCGGRHHLSELSHVELRGVVAGDGSLRRHRAMGLCGNRPRPPRLHSRSVAALCHRRFGLCRRALCEPTGGGRPRKVDQHASRLGRRGRDGIWLRSGLERAARISLQPVWKGGPRVCIGYALRLDARFPVAQHRPQPQGRLAGISQSDTEAIPERSGIRSLGNPRPDHLPAARLSGIPCAARSTTTPNCCRDLD